MKKQDDMEYKLVKKDYLELWTYFEKKATSVKGAMFNTITWIIGFAAALFGFIFANLVDYDSCNAAIPLSMLMVILSIAGLIICLYAFFALGESAKHISNNWKYADNCHKKIDGLAKIVPTNEERGKKDNKETMKIWKRLGIVVALFFVAFLVVLVWGFYIQLNAN